MVTGTGSWRTEMTPKARFFASQTAAPLRTNRIEIEEEIILTESAESDPDWGAAWAEDRFVAYDPEEIEVPDFDEVKAELGVKSGRA
jgi:hypothetical protein